MMEEQPRKQPRAREITYRVGWKKGKLEVGENNQVTASESAVVFMEKALWLRLLDRYIWRRAPFLPLAAIPYLLIALPLLTFGFVWWMVYMLVRV